MLALRKRARGSSVSVTSWSAEPMPQTIPPISCECAVLRLSHVPAAKAPCRRGTRISCVQRCTRTSAISAPKANIAISGVTGPAAP